MQGLRPPIFRRYPARQRRGGLRGGPIWVQQYRRAATHRRRTAASSTTEFQICRDRKASRGGVGLRQYRAVRWFLLPETELAAAGSGLRIANMAWRSSGNLRSIAFTEMSDYESLAKMQGSLVPAILPT